MIITKGNSRSTTTAVQVWPNTKKMLLCFMSILRWRFFQCEAFQRAFGNCSPWYSHRISLHPMQSSFCDISFPSEAQIHISWGTKEKVLQFIYNCDESYCYQNCDTWKPSLGSYEKVGKNPGLKWQNYSNYIHSSHFGI